MRLDASRERVGAPQPRFMARVQITIAPQSVPRYMNSPGVSPGRSTSMAAIVAKTTHQPEPRHLPERTRRTYGLSAVIITAFTP